jgi:hypothetical protein
MAKQNKMRRRHFALLDNMAPSSLLLHPSVASRRPEVSFLNHQ